MSIKNKKSNHCKFGKSLELQVLESALNQGHSLLASNIKVCGVQLDLIVRSNQNEIWVIEVKSLSHSGFFSTRVKPAQSLRIRRALEYLIYKYAPSPVRGHLVTVQDGNMVWHYDYFTRFI